MSDAIHLPERIFREYDIRGIAGKEIDARFARRLGNAFARMLPPGGGPVVVGRDVRHSGVDYQRAVIEGLTAAGRDVLDIGMVPTPLAYFTVFTQKSAGCIMVTASHNPAEYNGFKMMIGRESMHGARIQELMELMRQPPEVAADPGRVTEREMVRDYHDFVTGDVRLARPLTVVVDAGNGPAGVVAAPIYRALGCRVIELYCEPDGDFPNHHPDPTVAENMVDLQARVRRERADLGIAFDGDGDRIGVVDERGEIIYGDMLLLLLARGVLKAHPGAAIISEVKCSQRMYDDIAAHGGRGIMWRTGHSPIKAKMKESGAKLAGEMSGHIFFADRYFGFDDAIYAGARVLEMVAARPGPISAMLDGIPPAVTTPEIRVECPDARKFALVEEAKAHFAALGYEIIDVDGMRIKFADGWGLVRASNTQPALVLRFEAPDEARLAEMRRLIEGWLEARL
ncbi:MAG: phosphomannomutase/phosphoglucomutase [Zetaproteobacteria bacterium]|nr:MAG: phosphomannomutase/phosphoglucomutase [Zetaproteobacteria bacterium]